MTKAAVWTKAQSLVLFFEDWKIDNQIYLSHNFACSPLAPDIFDTIMDFWKVYTEVFEGFTW